jgi:ATP-dependent protease HslVU (ClpYQ) ATPase subunit
VLRRQVAEARRLLVEAEIERALASERITREALRAAENDGIVFLDEIDKIVETSRGLGGATSAWLCVCCCVCVAVCVCVCVCACVFVH